MQVGDVVYLKSGGPAVTVGSVQDNKATVSWMQGISLQTAEVPVAVLVVDDPRPAIQKREDEERERVFPAVSAEPMG